MSKLFRLVGVVVLSCASVSMGNDYALSRNQRLEQRLGYWKKALSDLPPLQSMSNEAKFEELGKILRGIGEPDLYSGGAKEEAVALRSQLQEQIISVPGHAVYFKDKIKKEQAAVQDLPKKGVVGRLEYDKNRDYYIQGILVHLPSAETIRVLGELLWDDQDAHKREEGDDWSPPQNNSYYAAKTLRRIGLRECPQPLEKPEDDPDMALWRAWYEEVKSGKRSFSFVGQNVEYRLNPDGSVSSSLIKLEEERPAPVLRAPEEAQQRQPTAQDTIPTPAHEQPARRLWIVVGLILTGLIAAVALGRRGKRSH